MDLKKRSFSFENWEDIGSLSRSPNESVTGGQSTAAGDDDIKRDGICPKREPRHPTDIVFRLNWSVRDEVIVNLSQHSQILLGKTIQEPEREKMKKKNLELLCIILELPLQAVASGPEAAGKGSAVKEVALDLDEHVRARIVSNLSLNHNLSLLHSGQVADETKAKMLKQNRELIADLWNLPVRVIEEPEKKEEGPEAKCQGDDDDELDLVTAKMANMKAIELDVEAMREKLKSMDVFKKNARLIAEFGDLKTFLETGVGDPRSETFYCRGFTWYVALERKETNGKAFLGIFLHHKNKHEKDFWTINTAYEFFLINHLNEAITKTSKHSKEFKKDDEFNGWGCARMIDIDEVTVENGWISKDGKIKVQIDLCTDKFTRF